MRFTAIVLLLALLAVAVASRRHVPGHKCFYKKQRCCYKYRQCGYKTHERKHRYRCDYKKCGRKCRHRCQRDRYGKNRYGKKRCGKGCYRHCYRVQAFCYRVKYYRAPKYCPYIHCGPYHLDGRDRKPGIYYGKEVHYKDRHVGKKRRKRY